MSQARPAPFTAAAGRRGRRSGVVDEARRRIQEVAREQFESRGYAGVSMRGVAREAGVDAALVSYYFGGKRQLFLASVAFPQTPGELIASLADVPVEDLGVALVSAAIHTWGDPSYRAAVQGVVQEAITAEMPFEPLGRFAAAEIMGPIANRLSGPDRFERAALACSHVMGVLLARHFAGIPSLVDVEDERLIEVVGAVAQHYLTGDLAEPAAQATSA